MRNSANELALPPPGIAVSRLELRDQAFVREDVLHLDGVNVAALLDALDHHQGHEVREGAPFALSNRGDLPVVFVRKPHRHHLGHGNLLVSFVVYYILLYLSTLPAPPRSLGFEDGDELVTFQSEGKKEESRYPLVDSGLPPTSEWRGRRGSNPRPM